MSKLSARKVSALMTKPGRHSDGDRLYLEVPKNPAHSRYWVFMYTSPADHKQREMSLGRADLVTLAEARDAAMDARRLIAKGRDPRAARDAARAAKAAEQARKTFGEVALELIASKRKGWKPSHQADQAEQWERLGPLKATPKRKEWKGHAAAIWNRDVDSIVIADVLAVLKTLSAWPDTAVRVRLRIEAVLDAAKARGLRSGDNPAAWKGNLAHLLPQRPKIFPHHAALPYQDVSAFVAELRHNTQTAGPLALEFCILTAARTSEVRFARWSEFDLDAKVWTVPPSRMKAGQEHRVPLSQRACEIIEECTAHRINDWVFPGRVRKQPMGENAMHALAAEYGVTVHGFRSSFRDWSGDETSFPREVCEQALAHTIGGVEGAYRRGDALEKRRVLMDAWANYIEPRHGNVVNLRA